MCITITVTGLVKSVLYVPAHSSAMLLSIHYTIVKLLPDILILNSNQTSSGHKIGIELLNIKFSANLRKKKYQVFFSGHHESPDSRGKF